jgi:small-conductance mechanosensitive channel
MDMTHRIMDVTHRIILGNSILAWGLAAVGGVLSLAAALLGRRAVTKRFEGRPTPLSQPFFRAIIHLVRGTHFLVMGVLSLWIASLFLSVPDPGRHVIRTIAIIALAMQGALWFHGLMTFITGLYQERARSGNPGSLTTIAALGFLGKAISWTIIILLVLHNMGVNITTLVAGMGIGGVAVALALQNILSDIFASISIILDKPYQVGDFIIVGDFMGTVETIGIKSTRIRSQGGEQLVFSNGELLKSRIRNFKRLSERRVEFNVGVPYATPYEKVELVPGLLREIIESQEHVRLERVHFKEFGESSLTFEMVYHVESLNYPLYLAVQESINLSILRRFQEEEIVLTHPTRTLYVAQGVASIKW